MKINKKFTDGLRIVWAVAWKDIADAIRNKTSISIFLGVAVMMFSGHALPLMLKLNKTPMAVVYDPGRSQIVRGLTGQDDLRLALVDSEDLMGELVASAPEVRLGLALPSDFDELAGSGSTVELAGYYAHWADPGTVGELATIFEERLSGAHWSNVKILTAGNRLYPSPDEDGFPFMIGMIFMITLLTIGAALVPYLFVEEKEAHTFDVLTVSPANYIQIFAGKALAGVFYCLVAAGAILLFDAKWIVRWDLMLLAIVLGSLFTVTLGLLVGSIVDRASNISAWAGLILVLLMVPTFIQNFISSSWPVWLQTSIPWIPSAALVNLTQLSMSKPVPIASLGVALASLSFGIIAVCAVFVWRLRRLER